MKESRWIHTGHCKLRVHCPTCRDLEGGRKWREKLAKTYDLPNGEIDFDCPHGVPWGAGPQVEAQKEQSARQKVLTEMRNTRFKLCKACKDDCAMHHKTDCQLRALLARPNMACPNYHFKPVDIEERIRQAKEASTGASGASQGASK